MKKILLAIFSILLILIISIYTVGFTSFGNGLVKDIAQKQIDKNLDIPVQINEFKLSLSDIDVQVTLNNMVKFALNGNYSIFKLSLDLKYLIQSLDLSSLNINEPIAVDGGINGNIKNIDISGDGVIFTSPLKLQANIKDFFPTVFNMELNQLDIEKLGKIAGFDYAKGFININANADEFNKENLDAVAKISLYSEMFLKPSVSKDFGINVSKFKKITISSNNIYKNNLITPHLELKSGVLSITTNFKPFNFSEQILDGEINTSLSELAFINPMLNSNLISKAKVYFKDQQIKITQTISGRNINSKNIEVLHNLNDSNTLINADLNVKPALIGFFGNEFLNVFANAKLDANGLNSANVKGKLLQSNLGVKIANNKLNANIDKLNTANIFKFLNEEKMVDADINVVANFNDFNKLIGDVNIDVNGKTIPEYFKKEYELDLVSKILAKLNVKINGVDKINFKLNANTDLVDYFNASGDFKNGVLNSNFSTFATLSNFNKLLNKNMSDSVKVDGTLYYKDKIKFNAYSKEFFGGNLNADLLGDNFSAKLNNVSIERLAKALDFIDIYAANTDADVKYNLKTQKGKIVAKLGKGYLKDHKAISLFTKLTRMRLSDIAYENGIANIDINKNLIDYYAKLNAKNSIVELSKGKYDTLSTKISGFLYFMLNGNEIKANISGTSEKINFKLDKQNTIENALKVTEKLGINEKLEEKGVHLEELGKEKAKEVIKDSGKKLLKNLLGGK